MKKQQKKSRIIMVTALVMFGLGMVFSIYGLSGAVNNIDKEMIAREPEAILASAGVTSGKSIDLPVAYYDQKADECVNLYESSAKKAVEARQFEWSSCGYKYKQLEQGLVKYELDDNYLPVAVGGDSLSNRGLTSMTRWFDSVEGKSKEYLGTLNLSYEVGEVPEFAFESESFYPLDEAKFSASDSVNKDGHNRLFTMVFAVPFTVTASGGEVFEITADDDTFVFVGTKLALDMGGIHDAVTGKLTINEQGEIYTAVAGEELAYNGIQVNQGDGSIVRIFHADRDSEDSVFKIKFTNMNLSVMQTQMAGTNEIQVAYDPTNPEYVAPLGESAVFRPDGTRGYVIMATVLGVVIVTCAMFTVIMAHTLIKNRK